MAAAASTKSDGVEALKAINKRQEAKIEKLLKTIEEKNTIIRAKEKLLSEVDDKIEKLQGVAILAQQEVQDTDARHSDEMTVVLAKLNELDAKVAKAVSKT